MIDCFHSCFLFHQLFSFELSSDYLNTSLDVQQQISMTTEWAIVRNTVYSVIAFAFVALDYSFQLFFCILPDVGDVSWFELDAYRQEAAL